MADVKKNDWFATLLYNPDLSMAEINKFPLDRLMSISYNKTNDY